jgi:hypothetical protein
VTDWNASIDAAAARYRDGESRLPDDPDERQRQLTRMGNAAWAAALGLLMVGRGEEADEWLDRAATVYRESFAGAPRGSWGRPIGAMKARVLANDWEGAREAAQWALDAGAAAADSPIGRYTAALAHTIREEYADARVHADAVRIRDDFPRDVGDALAFIAAEDVLGYTEAIESVLASFESRDGFLEDVRVADTVLVLQALAARRAMSVELRSELLPG